jgi:hypothetical protein
MELRFGPDDFYICLITNIIGKGIAYSRHLNEYAIVRWDAIARWALDCRSEWLSSHQDEESWPPSVLSSMDVNGMANYPGPDEVIEVILMLQR